MYNTIKPSHERLDDDHWREVISSDMKWIEGWNFDPGTTAHVYLKRGLQYAPPMWGSTPCLGRVVFMKRGRVIGFSGTITGNRRLVDHYQAMEKGGGYIPQIPIAQYGLRKPSTDSFW